MFGFCVLKERKETCTVDFLDSHLHPKLPEHRERYGTAMHRHAGFNRMERSRQILASTNGRSAAMGTDSRTHTATKADGAAFDRNKTGYTPKTAHHERYPLRPYKMGSFRIRPYWLCLAFFSFSRFRGFTGIGFVCHSAVEQSPCRSYVHVLAPMP